MHATNSNPNALPREPRRHLAVLTCMDARIDPFSALDLQRGDAIILRNAGGRVTDDVVRSLALAAHSLGVEHVIVMEHTGCALLGSSDNELRQLVGAQLEFLPISSHDEALRDDVESLRARPFLGQLKTIRGALLDLETGDVTDLVRWSAD